MRLNLKLHLTLRNLTHAEMGQIGSFELRVMLLSWNRSLPAKSYFDHDPSMTMESKLPLELKRPFRSVETIYPLSKGTEMTPRVKKGQNYSLEFTV